MVLIDRASRTSTLHPHAEMLRMVKNRWLKRNGVDAVAPYDRALKCGGPLVIRTDDGAGIVRERLKVYQRQTKPLVEYYAARATFRAINGNQAPDAVTQAIDTAIVEAVAAGGARS